jgi:hypothetical protein
VRAHAVGRLRTRLTRPAVLITARVLRSSMFLKRAGARSLLTVSPPRAAAADRTLTPVQPVIHVLLESAAVYCACLVATLATFLANNAGTAFIVEITPPIVVRRLRAGRLGAPR